MASSVNFNQIFKESISILLTLFVKAEHGVTLPNSFYKANIILIPKPENSTRTEIYRTIFMVNIDVKILYKIVANEFS